MTYLAAISFGEQFCLADITKPTLEDAMNAAWVRYPTARAVTLAPKAQRASTAPKPDDLFRLVIKRRAARIAKQFSGGCDLGRSLTHNDQAPNLPYLPAQLLNYTACPQAVDRAAAGHTLEAPHGDHVLRPLKHRPSPAGVELHQVCGLEAALSQLHPGLRNSLISRTARFRGFLALIRGARRALRSDIEHGATSSSAIRSRELVL